MSQQPDHPPGKMEDHGGIDTLMMLELPAAVRRIIRVIIRHRGEMDYAGLCQALDELPEAERLGRAEIDDALKTMVDNSWLFREGEGPSALYRVHLRRRSSNPSARDMWDRLESKNDSGASKE